MCEALSSIPNTAKKNTDPQNTHTVSSYCSIAVKGQHKKAQEATYKKKTFTWRLAYSSRGGVHPGKEHSGSRHGAGVVAESLHLISKLVAESELMGHVMGF